MITSRPACVVIIDFPRSSTSLLLLHVGMLQPPCRHVAVFMSACCSLHVYMLRPSCLHVAVFMSTCCSLHVCMLRTSCLHVAAFMSACCSVHVYMLQCSCLHVAAFMSTCCSVHVYMLHRPIAPGSNPAEFCSAPLQNQSSCVDQRLGAQQRPPSNKCRPHRPSDL